MKPSLRSVEELRAAVQASGLDETTVALAIDGRLDSKVWNGSKSVDRLAHVGRKFTNALLNEIEKSLLGQESFDDFERRVQRAFGVTPEREPQGVLRDLMFDLGNEVKIAWNDSLVRYNEQQDTVLLWGAELDDVTTPGCWHNHGKIMGRETFDAIPRHGGCRCRPVRAPDPESEDAEWAALGRQIIADMVADREDGAPVAREAEVPRWNAPERGLTRFRSLRGIRA